MQKYIVLIFGLLVMSAAQAAPGADDIFRIDLTIGTAKFEDILVIKGLNTPQQSGTMTVPGVFTVPIENLDSRMTGWGKFSASFEIHATENGRVMHLKYQYSYYEFSEPTPRLNAGTLTDLDTGKVIGTFTGRRLIPANGNL